MDDNLSPDEIFGQTKLDFEMLQDADDQKLLKLVASYRREEIDTSDFGSISTEGMAVRLLKKRGYDIQGSGDEFRVQTPNGDKLTAREI
ncbi:hypothetical protein [Haloarcula laminariae]|uniref:hypothetical protein n=1 Tax=Haloarcula laminariae TaxID=2961577 RepID=UPI0021C9FA1C|nr:hypothetical protein [Halomicroarcula laminariae]